MLTDVVIKTDVEKKNKDNVMRKRFFLSLIFCVITVLSFAEITLTIEVSELRNNRGQILLELSNEEEESVAAVIGEITDNRCLIVIDDLEPGLYAFRYFHDENENEKLDTNWLGIPREGFGFSNDPRITFGPPSFEKTLFEIKESKVFQTKPKYF